MREALQLILEQSIAPAATIAIPGRSLPFPDHSEYCGIFIVSPSFIEDRCA